MDRDSDGFPGSRVTLEVAGVASRRTESRKTTSAFSSARLAWAGWAACLAALIAALLLGMATVAGVRVSALVFEIDLVWVVLLGVGFMALPTVGAIVVSRHPRNVIGWLFLGYGRCWYIGLVALLYVLSGGVPARSYVGWFAHSSIISPAFFPSLFTFLLLLFPNGRVSSRSERLVLWSSIAAIGSVTALWAIYHPYLHFAAHIANPFWSVSVTALVSVVQVPLEAVLWGNVFVAAVLCLARFRRATGVERLQLRWFASAAVLVAVIMVLQPLSLYMEWVWQAPYPALSVIGAGALATATGLAISRYRLYDIDHVISRTVSYGLLTGLLVATYWGIAVWFPQLLSFAAGDSQLGVAAATLAAAALFRPARRRIQQAVDRRFNRARYDTRRTVESFATSLRNEINLEDVSGDLVATVRASVQPAAASLWLRPSGTQRPRHGLRK